MDVNLDINKVKRHIKLSNHYFENAAHFMELGEIEKASEFLWGSLSQALKAIAATRDIKLRSHSEITDYLIRLTRELKDEGIWYIYIEAQQLHSGFYESGLKIEDVVRAADDVKRIVNRLFKFIPKEVLE